ncbi:MAG: hypothetical protein RKO25_07295, partial [Candidatus Contendobacter sp.]|nr:hypothetical protein [Candidatus Contendobacter sp.]
RGTTLNSTKSCLDMGSHFIGDVKTAITRIGNKAEQTRQNRHSRLEEYIEISNSDDFSALKKLCQYLPSLENEIGIEYGRRVTESRRFWITVFLALLGIIIGLPGFYEWADHVTTNLLSSVPQQQPISPVVTPPLPRQRSNTAVKP